jgi:lambda family phage portal protein
MASPWRQRLASWLVGNGPRRAARLYGGARNTRTTGSFGGSASSADAELHSSLNVLRSRSRQMVRDSAYAKRAKGLIVNNVIGTGVGLQCQVMTTRGDMAKGVNDSIEWAWQYWGAADSCHTGGQLAFGDLERALMGEVFEAGEVLVRLHLRAVGDSRVPLSLELIEAERLAGDIDAGGMTTPGNELRMGIEVDAYQRPVAYFIRSRHGADIRTRIDSATDAVERVPAEQILHLKLTTRWPQTRGEPWMHAVLRKIDDINEYTQHEITAARASAAYFATITTPEPANGLSDEEDEDGRQIMNIDPLTIQELRPGESLDFHAPNRPNSAFAEFMRAMLREVAAGVGTSYEGLSRDYSQSNYSSSRLSLLDDRDGYKALQQWWVRSFRRPLHRVWLQQAVLARAITALPVEAYATDRQRYEAALFKCRGWSWVDPTKEVNAYKEAIKAGLTTLTDVIAATADGRDIEDVIATRRRELDMLSAAGIDVDTTVKEPAPPMAAPAPAVAEVEDEAENDEDTTTARVLPMRKNA